MKAYQQPIDAELYTIGAAFLDPSAAVRAGVTSTDFCDPRHRAVWSAVQAIVSRGQPVDPVSVTELLEARGQLHTAGGADYVADLAEAAATSANVEHHGSRVKAAAKARKASTIAATIQSLVEQSMEDGAADGDLMAGLRSGVGRAVSELMGLMSDSQPVEWVTMKAAKRQAIDQIQERHEARMAGRKPAGILPTGIRVLDHALGGGLEPGHEYVVDAPTGAGKTALKVQMAAAMAAHLASIDPDPAVSGVVVYYSCEVDAPDIAKRRLASLSGVDGVDLRSGDLRSDGAVDRLVHAVKRPDGDLHLRVGFRPGATVEWLTAEVAFLEATVGPVRAVIVDHWGEVETEARMGSNKEAARVHVATQINNMKAGTTRCPNGRVVIVGAQHKHDGSTVLVWGSALSQQMSVRMSWRIPGKGLPADADPGRGELVIEKNRFGPCTKIPLRWEPQFGRILDVD